MGQNGFWNFGPQESPQEFPQDWQTDDQWGSDDDWWANFTGMLGAMFKGKGKGKGKGGKGGKGGDKGGKEGKDGKGGKPDTPALFTGDCYHCGKAGHRKDKCLVLDAEMDRKRKGLAAVAPETEAETGAQAADSTPTWFMGTYAVKTMYSLMPECSRISVSNRFSSLDSLSMDEDFPPLGVPSTSESPSTSPPRRPAGSVEQILPFRRRAVRSSTYSSDEIIGSASRFL